MTSRIDPGEPGGFERRLLAALAVIDQQRRPAILQAPTPVPTPARHLRPRRPRLRRALPVVAVLAGLLVLTTAAVATLYNPATFEPDGIAVAGDPYPVKGSGCRAGSTVAFTLDDKVTLGATIALAEGIFSAEPRIPATTTLGAHDLAAACSNDGGRRLVQHLKLRVVSSIPPEPPSLWGGSAVAGGPAVVKGSGCRAGGKVVFTLDDKITLGATTAHRGGVFSAELPIPATTTLGAHDLAASCTDHRGKRLVQHAKLLVVKR